jgi:hypothetical protein
VGALRRVCVRRGIEPRKELKGFNKARESFGKSLLLEVIVRITGKREAPHHVEPSLADRERPTRQAQQLPWEREDVVVPCPHLQEDGHAAGKLEHLGQRLASRARASRTLTLCATSPSVSTDWRPASRAACSAACRSASMSLKIDEMNTRPRAIDPGVSPL